MHFQLEFIFCYLFSLHVVKLSEKIDDGRNLESLMLWKADVWEFRDDVINCY